MIQVVEGSSVTLTCSAQILESSAKPSYLWYKDEEPLIGEVESTYAIATVTSDDLGYYFCVVSDTEGQVERKSRTACISLVHEGELHVATSYITSINGPGLG